jgi:hypothetical protein
VHYASHLILCSLIVDDRNGHLMNEETGICVTFERASDDDEDEQEEEEG